MRHLISSFLFFFCLGTMTAQSCKSAPSIVSDLNGKIASVLTAQGCTISSPGSFNKCMNNAAMYGTLKTEMNSYYNSRSRSWATIGPRRLDFGSYDEGTIVSTGGRMYISAVPSNKNTLTIDIKELDGKGKVSYVVCKVDRNGRYTNLKTGWINEINSQKSNKRETRSHTLTNVQGYLITVHFDGKSVGNTFQYKVRVQ
ncbi:hypothetical protein [Neolewinella persica]|uniref:hypothetical protein n=1 Tax=Neolewinella persica TaxID=70998 RepID=UPI0003A87F84|nr:hypothetical protein [Neolewinella persica]